MMSVEVRILAATLARLSVRSIEDRLSAHGTNSDISGLQYGLLRTLSKQSNTLSELSRQFLLDPSTLVPVVDTLENKGLIERGKDPNDRRRIPLSLTPAGTALIESLPFVHEDDLLYQCLADMGKRKSRALLLLLRSVITRMPEGQEMLESISSRLYAYEESEGRGRHTHSCTSGNSGLGGNPGAAGEPDLSAKPSRERHRALRSRMRRRFNKRDA